jgi:hypothetical protein
MRYVIVDQKFDTEKRYQIMMTNGFELTHCFPQQMFTLEEAKQKAFENNFKITKIGTMWECI